MRIRPWLTCVPLCVTLVLPACGGGADAHPGASGAPAAPSPAGNGPSATTPGLSVGVMRPPAPVDEARPATPTPPPAPPDAGPPLPTQPPPPQTSATVPAGLLDLTDWKLTLPLDTPHEGSPDEIKQPELATFRSEPHFQLNDTRDGVVFRAPVEGATTSSSGYPRSELREMANGGTANASWSTTSGTHTLTLRQAITHLPDVKRHVVAGQIHDAEDDVVMVRLEGSHLFVEGGGQELGTLDRAYVLGTPFTVKLVASGGHIQVFYNDALKVDVARAATGCYFKAGAYTQSNLSKGDAPGAYGEVVIYDLQLTHG